jgi:ABC-type branched-subunit amino acid transport system substrate-binding protein
MSRCRQIAQHRRTRLSITLRNTSDNGAKAKQIYHQSQLVKFIAQTTAVIAKDQGAPYVYNTRPLKGSISRRFAKWRNSLDA